MIGEILDESVGTRIFQQPFRLFSQLPWFGEVVLASDMHQFLAGSEPFELVARPCDLEVVRDDLLDGNNFEDAVAILKKFLTHPLDSFLRTFEIDIVCVDDFEDWAAGPFVGISVLLPEIWFGVEEFGEFFAFRDVKDRFVVKSFEAYLGCGHLISGQGQGQGRGQVKMENRE